MGPGLRRVRTIATEVVALGLSIALLSSCGGSRLTQEEIYEQTRLANGLTGAAATVPGTQPVDPGRGLAPRASAGTPVAPAADASAAPVGATAILPRKSEAGKPAAPSGAASATQTPAACTGPKSEIAIGSVGSASGVIGAAIGGGVPAVRAGVAAVNAAGGINCHPVKYYVADDGGDPAKGAALAREMVEKNKVLAIVYSPSPFIAASTMKYYSQNKVAVIGSEGSEEPFNHDPNFFPVAATGDQLIAASYGMMSTALNPEQKSHVAVQTCIEVAFCSTFGSSRALSIAKTLGLTIVYNGGASLTQPDFTANCLSAKQAGAQAFFVVGDAGMLTRTARSCAAVNFTPQFGTSPAALAPTVVQDPNAENILASSTTYPWTDASNRTAAAYVAALTRYAPGTAASGSGAVGWASWQVFLHAAKTVGDNAKSADILAGLGTIKNNTFGGFTAPLTFTPGEPHPSPACWWTMVIKDKQFQAVTRNSKINCTKALAG
jgi:branched-chain amino acid transport system substrate-binding protein